MAKPQAALEFASAGQEAYIERFLPEWQLETLLRWVFEGSLDPF